MTPKQIAAIKGMLAYFDSGNNIPVDKAVIKANCAEVAALRAALAEPAPMQEPETVSVYGVKSNGEVVDTCVKAPMPPRMKAKDMVREMFGPWEEDDGSDSDLCFAVCESLLDWLVAQGWTAQQPAPVQEPVKVGCLRCNTPKKCDVWGCSPNTFPSEQPATPADVPMIEQKAVEPVGFVNRAAVNSAIIDRARGVGDTHTWSEKKTSFHSVPFYTSPQPAPHADVPMLTDEELREAFAQNLSDTYVCSRVWSAWSYGTMSEDDFSPASECDELLDSLVQAVRQKAGPT